MDKRIAGLFGAAATLTALSSGANAAQTQPSEPLAAASYRDLLEPVPNALALLKADDARRAETPLAGDVQVAQAVIVRDHHHHHHHRYGRMRVGPVVIERRHRHHHHHHHHHGYYRDR